MLELNDILYITGSFLLGLFLGLISARRSGSVINTGASGQPLSGAVKALAVHDIETAISILSKRIASNTEDIDAYLALGTLFRENGWFNRAVNLHQRLLTRASIPKTIELEIYYELALDYKAAGLIDRAINVLHDCQARNHVSARELILLAQLHESASQWQEAADAVALLPAGSSKRKILAFYQVMTGIESEARSEMRAALKKYRAGLRYDRKNPAALLQMGKLLAQSGKIRPAIRYFEKLQAVRPDLTGIIADTIESMIDRSEDKQLETTYRSILEKQPDNPRALVRLANLLIRNSETDEASRCLQHLKMNTLSQEMKIRYWKAQISMPSSSKNTVDILTVLDQMITAGRFVCHSCGTVFSNHEWRCPKCISWDTIRSRSEYEFKDLEGDVR